MYASGNNRPMIRINGLSMLGRTCAALGLLGAMATPAGALTFEYSFTAGTPTLAQDAFVAAGNLWSSVLFDPVTIKLTVGTAVLGNGTLAQAVSSQVAYNYTSVVAAMTADATSANDVLAVSNLPVGSVAMLINRTQENGNSATPYFDNTGSNSATIQMSTANAAALGLPFGRGTLGGLCLVACDGFIQFNSNFNFDYDRSNGLTSNQFDFIGIAAHEIGHSLGFISGVDFLDSTTGLSDNFYTMVSPLDLFRYSSVSAAQGAIDFSASTTGKYFSINGGTASTVTFSTGVTFGDGRQASHWKDGLGLGIMDPTSAQGELLAIGANDRLAMDVIGWNLSAVPEPGRPVMLALGLAVLGIGWRRRAQRD
jgi:hypothetical protein